VVERLGEVVAGPTRGLGDGLDFVTIATPWPDRYEPPPGGVTGPFALDDLLGRGADGRREAYVGRILGPSERAVYQAMCALFLGAEELLGCNAYPREKPPWSDYRLEPAWQVLGEGRAAAMPATREATDRRGWHWTFDGRTASALVFVDSSGTPERFHLGGGMGRTEDVPVGLGPAAVHFVHSFSAERPWDAGTIAGRWLASGAFAYYGAMNEPFLQAFRPPGLVAEVLGAGGPLGAAVRKVDGEDRFGAPWRLHLIGDPLWTLEPMGAGTAREAASGGEGLIGLRLEGGGFDGVCARALRRAADGGSAFDAAELGRFERSLLGPTGRAWWDALLADGLTGPWAAEAGALLAGVPAGERSGVLVRAAEQAAARREALAR
jgi:hypothetical protein